MNVQAFLRQQREALKELPGPLMRLCDDPVFDDRELPTEKRRIYLEGGHDEIHCREVRAWIEETVEGVGLSVPAESTAFEVGARELFALARDIQPFQRSIFHVRTYASSCEIEGTRIMKASEGYEISDVVRMAGVWRGPPLKELLVAHQHRKVDAAQTVQPRAAGPLVTTEDPVERESNAVRSAETPESRETPIAQEVPAGRDRLPPVATEPQRRDAVNDKLTRVRQDTDEPLPHNADFWKAAKVYQDRKTFENWIKKGPDAKAAHEVFCRLLQLPSVEFVAARRLWRKKPKRAWQKKKKPATE